MKRTNIDAILTMVKDYLDGNTPYYLFEMDFPYELEQRWKKMRREDSEYADMIYDYFIERGTDMAYALSDEKRLQLFRELYDDVLQGVW